MGLFSFICSNSDSLLYFSIKCPNDWKKTILRGLYLLYYTVLQYINSVFTLLMNCDNRKKGGKSP